MSVEYYQKLQQESRVNPAQIGNCLPKLEGAELEITSQELNLSEACRYINNFSANASWVMFNDRIEINHFNLEQGSIIEGEWSDGEQTITLKLLHDQRYVVTHLVTHKSQLSNKTYTEQILYLRNTLKEQTDANACRYRLWWQQAESGEQKGRWLPLAQQFIGFTSAEEITQSSQGDE